MDKITARTPWEPWMGSVPMHLDYFQGTMFEAVEKIATIDLKKDEPGIRSLAGRWKVPLVTYTAEELRTVKGNFTPSPFVEQVTGVDNVCERSAVLASNNGWILRRKWCMDGVTTALCQRTWRVSFE